jgi:signal peptidase II
MTTLPSQTERKPLWRWLLLAALVIALDQWSKAAIVQRLAVGEAITITPYFDLLRTYNTGAAFSFLKDAGGWQRWFFTGIAAVASVLILSMLRKSPSVRVSLALVLVLGGAIGNVIDRLLHSHVIDFLHFHWGPHSFPVFNVADCAITAGAALLLLDELLKFRRH